MNHSSTLSFDRPENYTIERLHVSIHTSLNKLYTTFLLMQWIRPWQSAFSLLLELIEWCNTCRDSLAHQKRGVLGLWCHTLRYLYCGIQKCFHPRMDWEQCGGEVKTRLVVQGVYAKPKHCFSMQIILHSLCYKFLILSFDWQYKNIYLCSW
jgi:hypothetical protein